MNYLRRLLTLLTFFTLSLEPVAADATQAAGETNELIVLLQVDTDAITLDRAPRERLLNALPEELASAPLDVRFLIRQRSQGATRARFVAEPDHPAALLEQYLVLQYPAVVDIEAIADSLRDNPNVRYVRPNRWVSVSATIPNDPLFAPTPSPSEYQWGSHHLDLPNAWSRTTGYGYVGILDTGIDTTHPDLAVRYDSTEFLGGNFRPHLSFDYAYNDANVDEGEPQVENGVELQVGLAGHGTHVAGIVAATPDNTKGVAGACWDCSLMIAKLSRLDNNGNNASVCSDAWIASWHGAIDRGAQILTMSLGTESMAAPDCIATPLEPQCVVLELGLARDVLTVAAAGNDGRASDWPADELQVFGAGGLQPGGAFWNDCPGGDECGSNIDANQFNTPAKDVLSTFYRGHSYNEGIGCDDSLLPGFRGWGPCTGTSMSSPYLAGSLALIRSTNPLLERDDVESILLASLENPPGWDLSNGRGKPNIDEAVSRSIGTHTVSTWANRLTPLFNLRSIEADAHLSTTAPQQAIAALNDDETPFFTAPSTGDLVAGYSRFPDTSCQVGPCIKLPRAWVHVFTTPAPPYTSAPSLVPLYRMSYKGPHDGNATNRSFTYTTERRGIKLFHDVGYQLDGIEGYIYPRCSPEPSCMPTGSTRLYRLYNFDRDDYAIFPESKLSSFQAQGYVGQGNLNDWIGYVYENVDTDGDTLTDGYEIVVDTDPGDFDTDCDGASDGAEVLTYPYSDPRDGPCSTSAMIGEVGTLIDLRHTPQTVVLTRTYTEPVIIAQSASFWGYEPTIVRITDVQNDRFTMFLHEPPNLNGTHAKETVSYIVIEAGRWRLAGGTLIEASNFDLDDEVGRLMNNTWKSIGLQSSFSEPPTVFTQVASNTNPGWIRTRQQNATSSGFQVALQSSQDATIPHGTETVGFLAIEGADGTWSGQTFEARTTANEVTHLFQTIQFGSGAFSQVPLLFTSLATFDGNDSAHLRFHNATTTTFEVKVEEETTYDTETNHTTESVSYLAIGGSGVLEGTVQ